MDIEFTSPDIYKKDLKQFEKTLGSIKEYIFKKSDNQIKLYIEKNNITEYNNESICESNKYVKSTQ